MRLTNLLEPFPRMRSPRLAACSRRQVPQGTNLSLTPKEIAVKIIKNMFALLSLSLLAACGGGDDDPASPVLQSTTAASPLSIPQTAQTQGFTALLAAVEKAGLAPALSDPNADLTVFAPTNAAFNTFATRLGFTDAAAMVAALPAETLADLLSFHVLPSSQLAAELSATPTSMSETLYKFEDKPATLRIDATTGVTITDEIETKATVTTADVIASNGVIHAIDKVLVPPGVLNIVQMAQLNSEFSSLVNAIIATDLQDTLSGDGSFTVFAPTNAAFAAAPAGLNTEQLTTVLTYHVLGSEVLAANIPFGTAIPTAAGQPLTINNGTPPTISDTTTTPASIIATDVRAKNGVIHAINKVLIPTL